MSADLAIINANIRTMNPKNFTAQAVAITKNKIVKVGTNQEINQAVGKNTVLINLDGKTVLPGLIDTHVHVADFGKCLLWLDLTSVKSIKEMQNLLYKKVKQTPIGKWIVGRGWNQQNFKEQKMPTTSDLDKFAPDNPVIFYHESAMICAVNSEALKLAGVTKETVAPLGGAIDKNPKTFELTGILRDSATTLVWQVVPEHSETELLEATALACQKIVEAGLTSVHWLILSENELPLIQKLYDQKRLLLRVNVVVPEAFLEKLVDLKTIDNYLLHVGGATIAADGYLDSKAAALFEPYSDEPKNVGKLLCTKEELTDSVQQVIQAGIQPIIFAMGDKAVDIAVAVIEKSPRSSVRFRIEQAAVLNKNLIQRIKKQDVVVSVQPKVISSEFTVWSVIQRLGIERARFLHPLKALIDEGVKVVGGSDCPMEPLSPLLGMQEVVLRESFPEQRLNVEEALRMYTFDAAYSSGEERVKGSIEEGKLADLTVLSSDPMAIKPEKISEINIELVIIDGKVVYVRK